MYEVSADRRPIAYMSGRADFRLKSRVWEGKSDRHCTGFGADFKAQKWPPRIRGVRIEGRGMRENDE